MTVQDYLIWGFGVVLAGVAGFALRDWLHLRLDDRAPETQDDFVTAMRKNSARMERMGE
ncbi:MAG: hypothetical protein GYB50_20655 [Rhodobacteraceae bacterium]|nr:hypothetical protein [Paracoccaceae bacterium]